MGEIRFVGTGETRGYPYLVCKKILSRLSNIYNMEEVQILFDTGSCFGKGGGGYADLGEDVCFL